MVTYNRYIYTNNLILLLYPITAATHTCFCLHQMTAVRVTYIATYVTYINETKCKTLNTINYAFH